MKLLNKLLPITIIASATACVTPFVASCSSTKTYVADWNYTDGVYAYTTNKHAPEDLSTKATAEEARAAATQMYFEAAEENPQIFAEDVVQKMSYYQLKPVDPSATVQMIPLYAHVEVKDVTFDQNINTITKTGIGYVTCTVDFKGLTDSSDSSTLVFDTYVEGHVEVNNVGFYLFYRWSEIQKDWEHYWDVEPALVAEDYSAIQEEEWSMSVDMNLPALGKTTHVEYNSDDLEWLQAEALANAISPDYCYYMNDVIGRAS